GLRGADTVHPALAGDRPAGTVRQHRSGHLQVVVDHLRLGGAAGRVEHLVQAGQLQAPAVELGQGGAAGHHPILACWRSPRITCSLETTAELRAHCAGVRRGEGARMRAIWKGAVTFGLVNVPVSVYSATESHDVRLHQVHDADGGRIRYQRRCEKCGEIVPFEHIDKAFTDGEASVVLTEDDLATLPAERSKEIDVLEFVPNDQVDPIMFGSAYYLAPT